jgi:hypothetical protein
MNHSEHHPILSAKTRYNLGENGFKEDTDMCAWIKNYRKSNGDFGCITVTKDKVTYILRNKKKEIIRRGDFSWSNETELTKFIKSALLTMGCTLSVKWNL